VKRDQEVTNILNALKKRWIRTLKPIRITLECTLYSGKPRMYSP